MTAAGSLTAGDILFHEVLFHPKQPLDGPEPVGEEFIELYNRGTNAVSLNGWRLTRGVDYVFGDVTMPAGGYLVVAADTNLFAARYPGVAPVVGNWRGRLSNRWQSLDLVEPTGSVQDSLSYATDGDWAVRIKGPSLSGTRGWEWYSSADGPGASLELIQSDQPNEHGQNWSASLIEGGTPGAPNSTASSSIPPMILQVEHAPAIPRSTDQVTIQARLVDRSLVGVTAAVHYRDASTTTPADFVAVPMSDTGLLGDGAAGDGVFAARLPAQPNGTIVEFFIEAKSPAGGQRFWPAPALNEAGQWEQSANALYQVDESPIESSQPYYRIVMTQTERQILRNIDPLSDAAMNATFISSDDRGTEIRYLCAVRIRGAGSRFRTPTNLRVGFPNDNLWKGIPDINLNTQYTYLQLAGARLAQKAGLSMADARAVQVRVNGANLAATGPDSVQQGSYVALEPLGPDWVENHYPLDSNGNLYRVSVGNHTGTLSPLANKAQAVSIGYTKNSNSSEDDWSDLLRLTEVLNTVPDEDYVAEVRKVIDVEQWMRYFAFMTMVTSLETSFATGRGDDYSLYRGITDPRFHLLVHDLDTVFGLGDTSSNPSINIFRMVPVVNRNANTVVLNRFMLHPEFVPIYFQELMRMIETIFDARYLNPFLDSTLKEFVNPDLIAAMKSFQVARNQGVLAQIPREMVITSSLPIVDGYLRTAIPEVDLNGLADVVQTRSVEVNGIKANWTAWRGEWSLTGIALQPGINRVQVRSLDAGGKELRRQFLDIWYDAGPAQTVSGLLTSDTTWTAAGGPYDITATLTVPVGRSLTIEPGATVWFGSGAGLVVAGRLVAEGTETARIRFTRPPGGTGQWNGIQFNGTLADNRIRFADFEFSDGGTHHVGGSNSKLWIEGCTWQAGGSRSIIELANSSALIRGNRLPDLVGAEHIHGGPVPLGGFVRIEENIFGTTTLLNDIIDFTGAKRPGPVLEILNNVFTAASDDVLDLDGTDAWVEGNLFMHVHKANPNVGDTSSAISFGEDNGYGPHVLAIRNFFYDVDHVALCKEGGTLSLLNNTAVGVQVAALNFSEPERNTRPGASAVLDGNLFWNPPGWSGTNFQNRFPTNGSVLLTAHRNLLLPGDTVLGGTDNWVGDPMLFNVSSNAVSVIGFRSALAPRSGSPVLGRGPNGIDLGAAVSSWASLSGVPLAFSGQRAATLTVGGPGISNYVYRVNSGPWSPERPVASKIQLNDLTTGDYRVEVLGRKADGASQPTEQPTQSTSWTVIQDLAAVQLNEILTRNDRALEVDGEFPDAVELLNLGTTSLDLSGFGLSDDPEDSFKFTFPEGTAISPSGYLVLYADQGSDPTKYLGFGLGQAGGQLLLTYPDGTIADSIHYGLQLADLSLSRKSDGNWGLGRPTLGSSNQSISTSDPSHLLINEWLANPQFESNDDFVELYNSGAAPVDVGGCYFSDQPVGDPKRHLIPALSFVAAQGYAVFRADGNISQGADHLGFKLTADEGLIGLADPSGSLIDCVAYGPQPLDRSEGRQPNGGDGWARFQVITPGSANPSLGGGTTSVTTELKLLVPLEATWSYDESGQNLGTEWTAEAFDDTTWPEGAALFGAETTPEIYPLPFSTPLTLAVGRVTYYFRTRFLYDGPLSGVRLITTNLLDDGAVYHLNGVEAGRRRMNANYDFLTRASGGPANEGGYEVFDISANTLRQGENVLAVEVHQNSLNSSDLGFAMSLTASRSVTNITGRSVVLNEVLASNAGLTNVSGGTPDWVELFNPGSTTIDLGGMSLTDDPALPKRWLIPAGVSLPSQSYLRIRFDADQPATLVAVPDLNAGFGLNDRGDKVLLYDAESRGSTLLDSISFGLQAADVAIGRVPDGEGAWGVTAPTFTGDFPNRRTPTADPRNLRLNEWMANPKSGEDWFELFNPTAQPVGLGGLYLTDDLNDRQKSRIPALSFIGASTNGFVRFEADNDLSKGADHVAFKLSNAGESLGLFLPDGALVDSVTFRQQYSGVSEGRIPDGGEAIVQFTHTSSPGEENHLALSTVVVSEILTHTDPPFEDAIELHNLSEEAVDIGGWFLSDSTGDLRKYRIPDGRVIQPGGFAVFYEYEFNALPGNRRSFSLSSVKGDQVYLSAADPAGNLLGYRSTAKFGASKNGVSFGRVVTTSGVDFSSLSTRSLGVDNPATTNAFHLGNGATNSPPMVGPIVISEIHYHPPNLGTNDNLRDEFIELRNITASAVPLFHPVYTTNTWRLRDAVDFEFPGSTTLPGGAALLLVGFDPKTNAAALASWRTRLGVPAAVTILGPYRGKLDNGSDTIELYQPDDVQLPPHPDAGVVPFVVVDRVRYSDEAPWPTLADTATAGNGASLQRRSLSAYGNEATNWVAGNPTAGQANAAALVTLPAITLQPQGARISEGLSHTLKVTASGAQPLSYQWRLGAESLLNATNSTYAIGAVGPTNVGIYTVVVSNPGGAVLSSGAVIRSGGAPAILEQPVPQYVEVGGTAQFSALVGGTLPIRYQWRREGANLAGATNRLLTLTNVQASNLGRYALVATNVFGAVTSTPAALVLGLRPSLSAAPQSREVLAGQNALFSVSVTGTAPFSYQWMRGTVIIPDATNSTLQLTAVSLGQSGDYAVVVSNLFGTVTSPAARLSVFPLPAVTVTTLDEAMSESGPDVGAFLLTRSYATNQPLTVVFGFGGTALAGSDYLAPVQATIGPGESSAVVLVTPTDDTIKEATETVRLNLALGVGYVVGVPGSATLNLSDNDTIPIGGTNAVELVTLTNLWRFEQTDDLSSVPWTQRGFDDSAWPSGLGALTAETANLPVPKLTPLVLGRWTYYFRTSFQLQSTESLTLNALMAIDDGAVVYLNGQEAYRVGMPSGDIVYSTPATRTVGNAILDGPIVLPATNLVVGENIVAVEVHQSDVDSSDVVFDLAITGQIVQQVPLELVDPQQAPNGDFAFNVVGTPGSTIQIEVSVDLEGWAPWVTLDLPPSGVLRVSEPTGLGEGPRFYRAKLAP
jgi:hypothetical protein